jgi:hypothetical protein
LRILVIIIFLCLLGGSNLLWTGYINGSQVGKPLCSMKTG